MLGATFPVLFLNCHGGSAKIVRNLTCPAVANKSAAATAPGGVRLGFVLPTFTSCWQTNGEVNMFRGKGVDSLVQIGSIYQIGPVSLRTRRSSTRRGAIMAR